MQCHDIEQIVLVGLNALVATVQMVLLTLDLVLVAIAGVLTIQVWITAPVYVS